MTYKTETGLERSYQQGLEEQKYKGARATFEIKVTDGLDADDELSLYKIFNTGDDDTVWVHHRHAEKATKVLGNKGLLR